MSSTNLNAQHLSKKFGWGVQLKMTAYYGFNGKNSFSALHFFSMCNSYSSVT